MSYKMLAPAVVVMLMFTVGCSVFERVVYRPDINQGNYLTATDVAKIHNGMTKQQVAYTLGTSMMKDPFGSNIWYYIFRREPGHESVTQQTLTLTFNSSDILTHIDNKPTLEGRSQCPPISNMFLACNKAAGRWPLGRLATVPVRR